MFFDENGMLRLDEMVAEQPTFKKIMEDQVVTDAELEQQANLVVSILKRIEETFPPEYLKQVEELLAETSVLYAASQYKNLQELRH